MADKVFVSPGIYTSEKDLTFVTRQVGVTTLGLVGETTQGPAFQPIFVSNYNEFTSFFGGLNNKLVNGPDGNGAPQYELPYIAKSYLTQSNQLFVTRVLGFSGYDGGQAWGISLSAALDPATVINTVSATTKTPLLTFTATTGGTLVGITTSEPLVNPLYTKGLINLAALATSTSGTNFSIPTTYTKNGLTFTGAAITVYVTAVGTSGGNITGTTSGTTTYYSGTGYTNVENKIIALVRSRATVNATTQLPVFQLSASTNLIFDPNVTTASSNPLANFSLSGVSTTQGNFDYSVSLDKTQRNYISKVLGRTSHDAKTAIFVEEFYENMFIKYNTASQIYGINLTLVNYNRSFYNYITQYKAATTPYFVSEVRGNKVLRLFRFQTISDGNAANEQFKISITNIRPDTKEFDVQVRGFYDTDAQPQVLEAFTRCTLQPSSNSYIGRKIGTLDGTYASKSAYILVKMDDSTDTSDAFPAGFVGYPMRDYTSAGNTTVAAPSISYKQAYTAFENTRKSYLGLSDTIGIDADFFDYKGMPNGLSYNIWTGMTNGFHMDVNASAATIDNVTVVINGGGATYSPTYKFDTGNWSFTSEAGVVGGPYEKIYTRKFTVAPFGGFDGWDIYRTRRSNLDSFVINGVKGHAGLLNGTFANRVMSNGDLGITSDYYAYLEAIRTFSNPEATNINVFATPGIDTFDNANLVEATIEMIETERADSIYIVTTPDTDASGAALKPTDVVNNISNLFDSNYTSTYWPWIQISDAENNAYIYIPPTRDVVRNIALTDNVAFPWFAVAGIQRGDVDAIKARTKLTLSDRDTLYEGRINPVTTFSSDGIKIWGNKTLQVADTALNRVNVRRLLLQARKLISAVSIRLLFEQDDSIVRNQFLSLVNPILNNIRTERGLTDFRVVLSNDPEDIDRNQLSGVIYLKPSKALEFIKIDFVLNNTGASFANS